MMMNVSSLELTTIRAPGRSWKRQSLWSEIASLQQKDAINYCRDGAWERTHEWKQEEFNFKPHSRRKCGVNMIEDATWCAVFDPAFHIVVEFNIAPQRENNNWLPQLKPKIGRKGSTLSRLPVASLGEHDRGSNVASKIEVERRKPERSSVPPRRGVQPGLPCHRGVQDKTRQNM
ncbi:hypothetical protein C8R45DRAFT_948347 [Mycena sanguinolenta]|nr:hypothetical protein C8R45DRAFT_948347 [Mycena sanguinolenta]